MEGQLSFTIEIEMHFPAWICIYGQHASLICFLFNSTSKSDNNRLNYYFVLIISELTLGTIQVLTCQPPSFGFAGLGGNREL